MSFLIIHASNDANFAFSENTLNKIYINVVFVAVDALVAVGFKKRKG